MKKIRAGRGLGDALYLQAVVRHLSKTQDLTVCTDWADVFKHLPVKIQPFTRMGVHIIAHYTLRKRFKDTSQFKDCCLQAGISENIEFKLDWTIQNRNLVKPIKKPYVMVQVPRQPMGRRDNYGIDLLPDQKSYQYAIDGLRERYTLVMVGKDKPIYPLQNIDLNLVNGTTVTDLIDLAAGSAGLVGYCSYMIPLAECLDKKGLFVWANKGLKSPDQYINTIRPEKILHKPTSYFFVDDKPADEAINAFLQQ